MNLIAKNGISIMIFFGFILENMSVPHTAHQFGETIAK